MTNPRVGGNHDVVGLKVVVGVAEVVKTLQGGDDSLAHIQCAWGLISVHAVGAAVKHNRQCNQLYVFALQDRHERSRGDSWEASFRVRATAT